MKYGNVTGLSAVSDKQIFNQVITACIPDKATIVKVMHY